jgi:hypothetical protein
MDESLNNIIPKLRLLTYVRSILYIIVKFIGQASLTVGVGLFAVISILYIFSNINNINILTNPYRELLFILFTGIIIKSICIFLGVLLLPKSIKPIDKE